MNEYLRGTGDTDFDSFIWSVPLIDYPSTRNRHSSRLVRRKLSFQG